MKEISGRYLAPLIIILLMGSIPTVIAEDPQMEPDRYKVDYQIDPFEINEEFNIDYKIEGFTAEGRSYQRILIDDGGIERGDHGEQIPFITFIIISQGTITDHNIEFEVPMGSGADQVPWMVPQVLGDDPLIDPEWDPDTIIERDTSYSLDLVSREDGEFTYRLKVHPISVESGRTVSFGKVILDYSFTPFILTGGPYTTPRKPVGDINYLIITDEDLVDEVTPLAEWKTEKGLFASIFTVQEIDEMYDTGDKAYKMRQLVMDMEAIHDLDYLLLAGDYDKVPTRVTYNQYPASMYGEPSNFASDSYFSCVDQGTTWNSNSNSRYAENGEIDDPYPDLAVGRLAINDQDKMKSKIEELVEREKSLLFDSNKTISIHIAGDNQNVPGESTDVMDHFWKEYMKDVMDDRETVYHDGSGTVSFTTSEMENLFEGGYEIYGYFSHGTFEGLPQLYDRTDVSSQDPNGAEGIMFAMACLTGWFDKPIGGQMTSSGDCFGEVMTETTDRGLVAYMGASRLALGNSDTAYDGDAPGLEEDYYRAVERAIEGNIERTAGDVYRDAVTRFSTNFYPFPGTQYDASIRTFLEYNLLGEPDAPLILEEPGKLYLDYDLDTNQRKVDATVTNATGSPVQGATVSISRIGELGISGTTDQNGKVTIMIPASNGGKVSICAFLRGCLHSNSTFQLPDQLSPASFWKVDPEEPDGSNGYYVSSPNVTLMADEEADMEYRWNGGNVMTGNMGVRLAVQEGNSTLEFRAKDGAGHYSEWESLQFDVDLTPIDLEIRISPEIPDGLSSIYISSPTVSVHSEETILSPSYSLDNSVWLTFEEPLEIGEGYHSIRFRGEDEAGNSAMVETTIIVDLSPALSDIDISHEPTGGNGYYLDPPTVALVSLSNDVSRMEYRWDSGEWADYTSPVTPDEGIHTLFYRSIDIAGNIEPERSFEFKVDTTLPEIRVEVLPGAPDGDNDHYISTPMISAESDDEIIYLMVEYGTEELPWDLAIEYDDPLEVPDGEWDIIFRTIDPAGNSLTHETISIKVDTEAPHFYWNLFPDEPSGTTPFYTTPPKVSVSTASDDARLEYRMNDGEWIEYSDDFHLPDGLITLQIRAIDRAGNMYMETSDVIHVDTTIPMLHIVSPENGIGYNGDDILFKWTGSDDVTEIWFRIKLDDNPALEMGTLEEYTYKDPTNGHHSLLVEVFDEALNSVSMRVDFDVDSVAPTLREISPKGNDNPLNSVIKIQFSEVMDRESVRVNVNGVDAMTNWDGSVLMVSFPSPPEYGTEYIVIVNGKDVLGNEMIPHSHTFSMMTVEIEEVDEGSGGGGFPVIAVLAISLVIVLAVAGILGFLLMRRRSS